MLRLKDLKGSPKGNDGHNRYENSFEMKIGSKDRHATLRAFILDVIDAVLGYCPIHKYKGRFIIVSLIG